MENFQPDDFLAGWVGGAAGVLVGHPLDTVKTRLQAGTGYNSMLHCITSIYHKETIRGFFKGMAFPLATVAMCNSVIFGVFGMALRLLSTRRDATTPCKPTLFDLISASALSGVAAVAVGSPIELVKIRLQMQVQAPGRQGTFRGPLHCFLTTLQQGGLPGVYRGGGAMLLRDIPGYCTYFVPYTLLCQNLTPQGRQGPHPAIIWLSGGVSGAISWGLSTPLDVVKSRLQADGIGKTKFHGVLHCIYQSYHTEGLRVFFRGTIVNCVRGFPMSAAMFLGYELSLKAIRAAQACAEL